MDLHAAIRTALLSMNAVTALAGSGAAARIRPDQFAKTDGSATTPAILVEIDDEESQTDLDGRGGLVIADVTLTCRAHTKAAAYALKEAVRVNGTNPGTGLAGYSGAFDAWLEDTAYAAVPKGDASDDHWHDAVMSFRLVATETA